MAKGALNKDTQAYQDIALQHEQRGKHQQHKNYEAHYLPSQIEVAAVAGEHVHSAGQNNGEGGQDEQQTQDEHGIPLCWKVRKSSRLQLQTQECRRLLSPAESNELPRLLVSQQGAQQDIVERMTGFVAGKRTDQRIAKQV